MNDDPKILLIRPSALGDVLRTVPVAASLRDAFPNCRLDWVVQAGFEDAVRAHPAVDSVISFPRKALSTWWRSPKVARKTMGFFSSLANGYDMAFDMQGLGRSGLMLAASRAGRRVGFSNAREFGWIGANERHSIPVDLHAVDRMLKLLEASGVDPISDMTLWVPPDSEDGWSSLRMKHDIPDSYVALAPTSRWDSKQWPAEYWKGLAQKLIEEGVEKVVLLGAPGEHSELEKIASVQSEKICSLALESTVGISMAVVRDASALVANDSAMLHAAVGFKTSLIGLFGPTDPGISGPYGHSEDSLRSEEAIQSGAHYRDSGLGDRLMRGIEVDEVLNILLERVDLKSRNQ